MTAAKQNEMNLIELTYSEGQRITTQREPFNKELMDFRANEDISYLVSNIMKGLEVIKGDNKLLGFL